VDPVPDPLLGIITIVSKISQYDQGTLTARKYTVPDASLAMCKHVGSDLQGWKIQFLTVKLFLRLAFTA
jgi:hypothetical protein